MTTRCSAVRAISLIRCDDTSTVRPSPARERSRVRIHKMPSGVEPVDGLVEDQDGGIAEEGGGEPEALPHSE